MTKQYSQPICSACWKLRFPDRHYTTILGSPVKECCTCGKSTVEGIYIRIDPETVPFPAAAATPQATSNILPPETTPLGALPIEAQPHPAPMASESVLAELTRLRQGNVRLILRIHAAEMWYRKEYDVIEAGKDIVYPWDTYT